VHGGKTDSCFINVQVGIEKAMSMVFPILAGAVGIGTVGHLENAVTFSPVQLVIDNEIFRYMHRALQPILVNEETLALDTIKQVGIGGNFLGSDHTVRHFRDELFFSDLFETMPWDVAHGQKLKGMEHKAYEVARNIWQEQPTPILSDDKIKDVDKVVQHAHKTFLG
jgi:trimethylamine--corrinoid protein Co-methyltransferase